MTEPDHLFVSDIKRWFHTEQKDLAATTSEYRIWELRGGEAIIIKALVANTGNVYIGGQGLTISTGFELSPGESIKVEYLPEKGSGEFIDLFAVCATAGDDVCIIVVP